MSDNEKLIEEALVAYWGGAMNAHVHGSVAGMRAAFALFEESPWGRTYTDAEIANALRRSEVPEPRRRMPKRLVNQLRRASGALEEYEFEGVAGDAPGLMNSAADLIEREWGSRPEPQGEPSGARTIPRPHVPYGPVGVPESEADANYLDHAAASLEGHYEVGGSNVRATVVKLLRDVAAALRAAGGVR